jgi:BASS family bile acid:Na+ symporter
VATGPLRLGRIPARGLDKHPIAVGRRAWTLSGRAQPGIPTMTLAELTPLVLIASVVAIVVSLGLSAEPGDLTYVLRRPGLLARSLLAMAVATPLLAVLLVRTFALPAPVALTLVALSLAPVPPILPRKQKKAGGAGAYALGLLVAAGLVSIVWVPIALELIERAFGVALGMPPLAVARLVAMTVLLPLAAGAIVARLAPRVAGPAALVLSRLGGLLLVLGLAVVLVAQWPAIASLLGDGSALAFALFVLVALAVGHALGGPDPADRTVLALATASRHPGVALAIAQINLPGERSLMAAVLLFLLVNAVASIPYVAWRRRAGAAAEVAAV